MDTFDVPNFERPRGWSEMPLWVRLRWLVGQGVVEDVLAGMEALKALGEWPADEEMGMSGGRGLSPERSCRRSPRADRPAPSAPPPRSTSPAPSSMPRGRRDRLSRYY